MNVSVTIDNSLSKVQGLTTIQFKALKKELSYTITNAYASRYKWARTKSLMDRYGTFPTGLLPRVQKWLFSESIKSTTYDARILPNRLGSILKLNTGHEAYKLQIEAINASQRKERGIIVAPTGFGKSLMIAMLVEALQVRTLIVVPTLELKSQLQESFNKWFGKQSTQITIENIGSPRLFKKTDYDCVIIDEFQRSASNTYQKLNKTAWKGVYYRFGFTATPFRNKKDENILLEAIISDIVFEVKYDQAVSQGHIVPLEAFVVECSKKNTNGNTYAQVYADLVVNNEERNRQIAELIVAIVRQGKFVLCLVKEIKHGENIKTECKALHANIDFANGEDEYSPIWIQQFSAGVLPALIGTTGILGEGVDTRAAEFVIIAGLGKSKPAFMQQCGRGFRKFGHKKTCKVFIFRDNSHKWTKAHFSAQVKYLREEYGVKPIELE